MKEAFMLFTIVSVFFNAVMFTVLMDNEEYITQQDTAIQYLGTESNTITKDQIDITILRQANEFMLEHCKPCNINKAIKATPLPSMKG